MTGKHADSSGVPGDPLTPPSNPTPPPSDPISKAPTSPPSAEEQRAELADTVSALAAKADVSGRLSEEASAQAARASNAVQDNPQIVAAAVGSVIAAIVVTIVLRRRRSRRLFR